MPRARAIHGFLGPRSAFIGRDAEIAALDRAIADGHRLISIVGPAGAGKTTLAAHYLERSSDHRIDDACWTDLAEVRDVDAMCAAVGEALEAERGPAAEDAIALIGALLAARPAITLVLDNVDHLVRWAPPILRAWLASAPGARLILTTRQRVGIPEELCVAVGPLPYPDEDATEATQIERFDAVRLFVERARRARAEYRLSMTDAADVAELVRRLDGLPLAIELCAARTSVLGVRQLIDRLDRRFELLQRADSTALPARRVTLRQALDDSWELLEPSARSVLAQCSVFRGSFDASAAAAILDVEDRRDSGSLWAVDALQALHDRSLLHTFEHPSLPGERRCSLLESVRDYAAEKLDAQGDGDAVLARHARYFVESAEAWAESVHGPTGVASRRRLVLERDNILAIVDRALSQPEPTDATIVAALRAALALESVFFVLGPLGRYESILSALLERAPSQPLLPTWGHAHAARGWVRQCMAVESASDYAAAVEIGQRTGDADLIVYAHSLLALRWEYGGRAAEARAAFTDMDPHLPRVQRAWIRAHFYHLYGVLLAREGSLRASIDVQDKALDILRELGDREGQGKLLGSIGAAQYTLGELRDARARLSQSIVLLLEMGVRRRAGWFLGCLGMVAQEEGAFDEARQNLSEARVALLGVGDAHLANTILGHLGDLALEEGDFERARALYVEALPGLRAAGDEQAGSVLTATTAAADACLGDFDGAERRFAEAGEAVRRLGYPGHEDFIDLLRVLTPLTKARAALRAGEPLDAERLTRAAIENVSRIERRLSGREVNADMRFALRVVKRHIAGLESALPRALPAGALVVAEDGAWFQPPKGERVELETKPILRRLLASLANARAAAPSRPVLAAALIQEVWVSERIRPDAASARLRVAISELRKLGLREAIVMRSGGYLIASDVEFLLVRDPAGPSPSR